MNDSNLSKYDQIDICPPYSDRLYAIIANQYIGKEVTLPASRKNRSSKFFIKYIHQIPRNIQQRLAVCNAKSWNNMVYLYNSFADELGYEKITHSRITTKSNPLRFCDTKDKDCYCDYDIDDMVYLSSGVYIHKDDCLF